MNKEEIYDSEIAPLMTKVIAVCKANKIAVLASFHIPTDEDENLHCTTALLSGDYNPPPQLVEALNVIRPPARSPLLVTTRDADGNVTRIDAVL